MLVNQTQADYGCEISPGKNCKTLSEKQTKRKRTKGMAQVVECLPSKCETLKSPVLQKKKKKEKFWTGVMVHAETGRSRQLEASLDYTVRPSLKQTNKKCLHISKCYFPQLLF
jgi:hypothetical protein